MRVSFTRWGKWAVWVVALLALGGSGYLTFQAELLRGLTAASTTDLARAPQAPSVRRIGYETLSVQREVIWSLGIKTAEARQATQPRALAPLSGCLAIDNNRLARVHSRFAGEVVTLGTADRGETDSPVAGPGARPPLQVGDRVEAGQLLAVVWSKDLGEKKSELVDVLSQLRLEQETLSRLKSLTEGIIAQRQLKEAERAVEAATISVNRAEATLRSWRVAEEEVQALAAESARLGRGGLSDPEVRRRWARVEVRAPFAGVILERNTNVGDVVDTSADLFRLADLSQLRVWANVYEDDLPTLQALPQPITWVIRVPSRTETEWTGAVQQIGAIIDPNQHTALVTGLVDNSRGELRVGQFITATIMVPPRPGEVEIPTGALVEDGRESVVFVQEHGQEGAYSRRRVGVTHRYHDTVYLRTAPPLGSHPQEPLSVYPGERVVTSGALLLNQALNELPLDTEPTRAVLFRP